jgi:nitroreductase
MKKASTNFEILEVIAERWSPYSFDSKAVPVGDLRSLFEAARWAASSFNEQPWRYIVATKDDADEFERILSCLVDANQSWAKAAPVLALGIAKLTFTQNGKPNVAAIHDLGQGSATLALEATARGLSVHQMTGILPDRARELFGVPEDFEVVTAIAIGYAADPESLPPDAKKTDTTPRQRKPISEIVFGGEWGNPSKLAE